MKYLLDTHVLLWAVNEPSRLPQSVQALIEDSSNEIIFSAASIWEVVIKNGLGRDDFYVDPRILRRTLLDHDYQELLIKSEHCLAVSDLPLHHKDPFDRILIAQACVERICLLTNDHLITQYPGPIKPII